VTNFILRIKEQETRLILYEYDDNNDNDDDDDLLSGLTCAQIVLVTVIGN
jgi:hypothetical protein